MRNPIIRQQDPTTTPVDSATQTSEATSQLQSPEGTTTPRASNSPSQTAPSISSTDDIAPTSRRFTSTTNNEPTTAQQTSSSVLPITTQSATSRTETSEPQTSTSSLDTSISPTSQNITPSASVTPTQSDTTGTSLSSATSSASHTVSTSTSISLSVLSSTVSTSSNPPSSASNTQTSSLTSVSSSSIGPSTSPTSTAIITTPISTSDTSLSPTPTPTPAPTPTPTPTPTSSTTPARESSTTSDSTSSPTLTSVLVTTVATVNGQPTTITTIVPTLASSPQEPSGLSARSSKIVGGVIGGTLALLGVLLTLFYISRRRRKVAAVRDAPRLQGPRQMLDADDFDLAEPGPSPYAYGMVGARANPNASGSIFHEGLPGTSAQHSHSYSRSIVGENDPLLVHHMRGESAEIDSLTTSSPRESTHLRASSTTGLLYDPNDPFGDPPLRPAGSSSSRSHPLAVTKALEARSRGSDPHAYPPSAFRSPANTSGPLSTSSPALVHQDAGRVDIQGFSAPPAYGNTPR